MQHRLTWRCLHVRLSRSVPFAASTWPARYNEPQIMTGRGFADPLSMARSAPATDAAARAPACSFRPAASLSAPGLLAGQGW